MVERFDRQASQWDKLDRRVVNAKNIADVIKKNIELKKDMHLMDFGAGTGLLSEFLAEKVAKITAVDNSKGMVEEFLRKDFLCKVDAFCMDYIHESFKEKFDGIVSSMTIHHIDDIQKLFKRFYDDLKPGGFIALADLDSEDGTFHECNDGVCHFGFDFEELENIARKTGFTTLVTKSCGFIKKPHKDFEVKVLTGFKVDD